MKSILIVGNGKWANKILAFIQKTKIFDLVYIKSKTKSYIIKDKKKKLIKSLPNNKKINIVHICTPVSTHYNYVKKFIGHNNLIVEKPFLKNFTQFLKIKKKTSSISNCKIIVNYIDLYNPLVNIIKKKIKNKCTKILIEYSNTQSFFKKKYLCSEDWLEHPLSLILYLFKKFTKFKILNKIFVYENKKFLEKIKIQYLYKKKKVIIKINFNNSNKRAVNLYKKNKLIFSANLKNQKNKNKFNNLFYLYNSLLLKKFSFYHSMNFYKKILVQRVNILNSLKNNI